MREDDQRIVEWLGWKRTTDSAYGICWLKGKNLLTDQDIPHYTTSNAAAISLLPVLVEKEYYPLLELKYDDRWHLELWERVEVSPGHFESGLVSSGADKTIAAAITTAVLQLIKSEATA